MQTARGRAFLHVQEEGNGAMRFGRVLAIALCVFALGSETMAKNGRVRTPAAPSVEMGQPQDGTGNLSKQHRDDLVCKLCAIKNFLEASKATDTNAVQLLRFAAEVEKEVRTKKYGLVFEEHKERVDVELEHNLHVLTEDKKRFIDNGGEVNFLIEGDNLAALKLLEKTHRGRIDLIYIDPPYNTGNKDFVYNDSYVDATDTFRHSKWLSFMKKRLEIARRLLTDEGSIFISIDDNEYAALKMLCDSIFGESCFVNTIAVKMSEVSGVKMSHVDKKLPKLKEYCLVYCRDASKFRLKPIVKMKSDDVEKITKYAKYYSKIIVDKTLPVEDWEIISLDEYFERCGMNMLTDDGKKDNERVLQFKLENAERMVYRTNNKAFENVECDKKLAVITSVRGLEYIWWEGKQMLFLSDYIKEFEGDMWMDISTINLNKEGYVDFANGKKPVKLISRCVATHLSKNALVLDFFAGSGTTGHAVMNLNAKDGGKRKFILVTNNENGICEKVTYERLKRVIEKENYAARLKYYKIGYVPIDEKVYYEYANDLLKHIRELVELENAVDFSKDKTVAIALTDKELEKFVGNDKRLEACKAVYVGHDVLIGSAIKATLKKHGVKVNIIPQYYYPELEG